MSDQELDQARVAARKIGERIKNEPSFKEQVEKDPHGTLTAAGLPEQYVDDFMREAQLSDVAGYIAKTTCLGIFSCILGTMG